MARRQGHELLSLAKKERVVAKDQRADMQVIKGRKRSVNLASAAGLQDWKFHSLCLGRYLCFSYHSLGSQIIWVH